LILMKFLSPILLSISSILGIFAIVITSFTIDAFEDDQKSIKENLEKIAQLKVEMTEEKEIDASKLAREKNRNLELENEIKKTRQESAEISQNLDGQKDKIDELQQNIENATSSFEEIGVQIESSREKLESIKSETLKYKAELPSLVGKIDQAKSDGDTSISQKIRLQEDLKNYPEITSILRNHYKRVLKAMRKYSMDRPWLERGEVLALQFNSIDLRTGLISLPVGTEEGIKGRMLFAVQRQGNELCKIRIKRVSRHHCLAEIIPMVGQPQDLQNFEKFDLVVL
jgi:chromosome segregation ATPase